MKRDVDYVVKDGEIRLSKLGLTQTMLGHLNYMIEIHDKDIEVHWYRIALEALKVPRNLVFINLGLKIIDTVNKMERKYFDDNTTALLPDKLSGAMQSIDRNIYESAELDGAGFWKKHFYVTIPQILPILMPVIIMATFTAFKQFDIVYLMTMQTGSKTGADINTVITYVYEKAFITSNYGYSSAVAFIVFLIILVLYKTMNRREFSISEQ